jgi:hypothetical protein
MITAKRRGENLGRIMRPWLYGIPAFLLAFVFLLWSLSRLASWIFALLKVTR